MTSGPPKLTLASESVYRLDRPQESLAERVRRRQFEAQMLAREHIGELQRALAEARLRAGAVSDGGEVYSAALREITGQIADYLDGQASTLESLVGRGAEPAG